MKDVYMYFLNEERLEMKIKTASCIIFKLNEPSRNTKMWQIRKAFPAFPNCLVSDVLSHPNTSIAPTPALYPVHALNNPSSFLMTPFTYVSVNPLISQALYFIVSQGVIHFSIKTLTPLNCNALELSVSYV